MKKEIFKIRGMDCPSCALTIEKEISKIPGVKFCQVNFPLGQMVCRGVRPLDLFHSSVLQAGE